MVRKHVPISVLLGILVLIIGLFGIELMDTGKTESTPEERKKFNTYLQNSYELPDLITGGGVAPRIIATDQIDRLKGRIITEDNQIIIGQYKDFNGIRVSRPGIDVRKAAGKAELLLDSSDVDDWEDFNATNFAYSNASRISISSYTPSEYFQIGDKLKIVQTTTKYFYVIGVGANYIDVNAGSDYSVANAAITSISKSRLETASGFPGKFNFSTSTRATTGGGTARTLSNLNESFSYEMRGTRIFIWGSSKFDVPVSNDVFYIYYDFPFALRSTANDGTTYLTSALSFNAAAAGLENKMGNVAFQGTAEWQFYRTDMLEIEQVGVGTYDVEINFAFSYYY